MTKKKKNLELDTMTPQEWMRFEIAKELGFEDKIREHGWGALSAQESGRIGGMIASRNRKRAASAADASSKTASLTDTSSKTDDSSSLSSGITCKSTDFAHTSALTDSAF